MPSSRARSKSTRVCGTRHLRLEEGVDLLLVLEVPARKEGGQREFRKDDQVAAVPGGLPHQVDQPGDDLLAGFGEGDRSELRGGDGDNAGHGLS